MAAYGSITLYHSASFACCYMNHGEFVHIPSSSTENLPHYSKAKQAHARRCRLIFSQTCLFDTCDKQTAEKEAQRCCFPCPAFSSLLRLLLVLPFPPLLSFLLSSFFLPLLSLLLFLSFVLLQFNAIKPMNALDSHLHSVTRFPMYICSFFAFVS